MIFSLDIVVSRNEDVKFGEWILKYVFVLIIAVAMFLAGLEIDREIIWAVVKKPIGPTIGLICQFVFMPLCAFGLAKAFLIHGKPIKEVLIAFTCGVQYFNEYRIM